MKTNPNCIFFKIVAGEEQASKVFEDDDTIAAMSLRPINKGEVLIIPKEHIDHFDDIPDEMAAKIILLAQRISKKIKKKFNPKRVGYVVHGFGVPHAHFAVFPMYNRDDITAKRFMKIKDNEIVIDFEQQPFETGEELDKIAEMLKENF